MARRIAEQTKEWIIEAFIDLLKIKSFEEIKTHRNAPMLAGLVDDVEQRAAPPHCVGWRR